MTTFRHETAFFSLAMSADHTAVYISMDGDIDHDSVPALTDAVERLRRRTPHRVFIDLGAVAFACSTLVNFLAQAADVLPPTSTVVLCRPSPASLRLLRLCPIDTTTEIHDDLPTPWPDFGPPAPAHRQGGPGTPALPQATLSSMAALKVDRTYPGRATTKSLPARAFRAIPAIATQ